MRFAYDGRYYWYHVILEVSVSWLSVANNAVAAKKHGRNSSPSVMYVERGCPLAARCNSPSAIGAFFVTLE